MLTYLELDSLRKSFTTPTYDLHEQDEVLYLSIVRADLDSLRADLQRVNLVAGDAQPCRFNSEILDVEICED